MAKTRMISVRDFRANLTKCLKESHEKNIHFVVMRYSIPVARVEPIDRNAPVEDLVKAVARARNEVKEGKIYSADEVRDMLGL